MLRVPRLLIEWVLVAALSFTLVAGLAVSGATWRIDGLLYDAMAPLTRAAAPADIIIVAIDDRSVAELGRWPWSRSVHAKLLDRLAAAGPAAIAYDVLFPEADAQGDAAMAEAMRRAGRVYLPILIETPGPNGAGFQISPPVAPLRAAAAGLGEVVVHPDADGIVRRAYLTESAGGQVWPHLMQVVRQALDPASKPAPSSPSSGPALRAGDEMLIPFVGPPGSVRTVSFAAVLAGETPPEFFRGKTVLVGATASGLGDRFPTPVGSRENQMAGAELQANMLQALRLDRPIRPLAPPLALALNLAPIALLLAAFLRLRPRANIVIGTLLLIVMPALSALLLVGARVWLPVGPALAGLIFAYPLWGWRRLEGSSAYLIAQLEGLRDEPAGLGSSSAPPRGVDVVERQLSLMTEAIGRIRDLRRFVSDAVASLPDATFVTAIDGRIVMRSAAADRLAERLQQPAAEADAIEAVLARLQPVEVPEGEGEGEGAGPADSQSRELASPDGSIFRQTRAPILDHRGETVGWIVRLTDLTAIRQAQRQREELLQLLSHDMRSPQASILALLDQEPAGEPSAGAAQRIRMLARRTLALADGFVRLARAEAGPLTLEELDLHDLLSEAMDEVWPQSTARKIAITAPDGDDPRLVRGDGDLIRRALVNLIGNAVRHSPVGGVVRCTVGEEAGFLTCAISDQGEGLDEAARARLFLRFQSGSPARGATVSGVGLGLAFVQAVARRHGGGVACASQPGQGSTFTLSLPAA